MSLVDIINVKTHYTRSINMERDSDSMSVVEAYIPTTRALRTMRSMVEALSVDEAPRAWSLVGPYGSGKSSFAVFLTHLLSDPASAASQAALKKLRSADAGTARKFAELSKATQGYCTVLLTGSPESLAKRLVDSLAKSARSIWANRRGRSPSVVDRLDEISQSKEIPTTTEILSLVEELQTALARIDHNGLLIVIDELGKFLEYEARHYGANDIFLLQALAEHALAKHDSKLSIVVMLHQAFEQYARGLGESLRNEWAKVQGRFENIPFVESAEQVLRIVAEAIEQKVDSSQKTTISKGAKRIAKALAKAKALPGTMDEATAADLFERCYPLHPISALLLPRLCQKVAQNERTLFSYLGSREGHGFHDGIKRCEKIGDWIYPWEIYEYFILNQSAALSDHFTHRRWAEVVTATERLGDAQDDEAHVLKAIGLLNIIGGQGNFKSSKSVVSLCLPKKAAVDEAIKGLSEKSIIQYRKFSAEYRVWQGSDFDLEATIQEELEKIGRFNLAESLNNRHSLMPIVARKYTIQSGALRYFYPTFTDAQSFSQLEDSQTQARIVFYLAESKDDELSFHKNILDSKASLDIRVLCLSSDQLREATSEVLALEEIQRTAQALNSDPVAQREFKDRYSAAVAQEEELLDRLTSEPQSHQWFWKNKQLDVVSKRSLQEELSRVLSSVYCDTPIFKNELINRDKPSSQANAARNKLVIAMFNCESDSDLGIEKFPPEKAIYRSCLRETKLHTLGEDGQWVFRGPKSAKKADDPCNIYPVWHRIEKFLDSTEQEAKSLIELNRELMSPPFGIKEGMLPILFLTVLVANQQELAIYESKVYTPYLTEEQIERFLKRPDEFTVQRFRISGLNQSIHEVYATTLFNDGKSRSILALAKPLAKMILNLPVYTQYTQTGLSQRAKAVRNLFKHAKSPITLMLEDLPKALGVDLEKAKVEESELCALSKRLMETLRELQHCFTNMKGEFRELLAATVGLDKATDLAVLREAMAGRCRGLDDYTIDRDGLKAYIQRALKTADDPDMWFDNILAFLGQKSPDKWIDTDRASAEYRLVELSRKITELERLRLHYQDSSKLFDSDFDVYLLRTVKKGAPDYDEVVAIDKHRHEAIKSVKADMLIAMDGIDGELKLAALAELVDDVLAQRRKTSKRQPTAKAKRIKRTN
ncbi:hypothetical protein [Sedimenticola selenatireducens]|uniref:hypothetical protein n=1 Tax=Sedimenticola selenatireducens TaxID=191960 RepID=UPI002AAB0D64|nr:hypothetical protein [Sedimenticola selenatireducens]